MHRWFEEVWNQGRSEVIDELMGSEIKAYGLGPGGGPIGAAEFKGFHRQFRAAFPDIRVHVEDVVVEGNKAVARCSVTGTHLGDTLDMAPTGRKVQFTGMTFVVIREGKIVEGWNNFDFAGMFEQLK
jgi:predicted ester cyclase